MTTDELRAKFEAWWVYHFRDGNGPPPSRRLSGTGIYTVEVDEILWTTWQAAYASRDAEVEALIRKYEKRSMYEDGGLYSNIIDDLQELLGK